MERLSRKGIDNKDIEQRKSINLLMSTPFIKNMLKDRNLKWVIKPREARDLDIVFIKKDQSLDSRLSSIPIFGLPNCIGVKISKDEKEESFIQAYKQVEDGQYEEKRKNIQQNNLTDHDDIVAVLAPNDIPQWISFFEQIENAKLNEKFSQKQLIGLSGLERTSNIYRKRLIDGFNNVIGNKKNIFLEAELDIDSNHKYLDFAFVKKDGRLGSLLFHHVRESQLDGQILRRTISHSPKNIVGAIVKKVGENERDTWNRALAIQQKIVTEEGVDDATVLVISGGQLSLFEKWGFEKPLKTSIPDCSVNLREVMDFLFLGQGNDDPGILALEKNNFSLPRNFSSFGIDVLFEKRDDLKGKILAPINGITALDFKAIKNGDKENNIFCPIDNVVGIVCVPDEYDHSQIMERIKNIKTIINRISIGSEVNLLPLNSILFKKWKELGEINWIVDKKDDEEAEKKHFLYTNGNIDNTSSELRLFPLGPTIGSARMLLTIRKGNEFKNFPIDWGTTYSHVPLDDLSLIGRASVSAIRNKLRKGQLPIVSSIYSDFYLLKSAEGWPAIDDGRINDLAASFVRAEITKRVSFEDACNVLGKDRADKIFSLGKKDIERWYGETIITNGKILFSHSHKDHSGMAPFLEGSSVSSWITSALLLASSNHSNTWLDNFVYQSRVDLPKKGSSYIKINRDMHSVFYHNEEVDLAEDVRAKFYFTNHSDSGSVAIGISTPHGKILYSGDIEPGPQTDITLNSIAEDEYNNFLWECTNPKFSNKPSVFIKEQMVVESFEKVFNRYNNHLIVIAAPHNYIGRLESIIKAINQSKNVRDVYVGLKHADILNHLRKALITAPLDATGRDLFLPEPGEDVGVYQKPAVQLRPWQKITLDLAKEKNIGVIEQKDLKSIRGNSVLVISPFDYPENIFGGAGVSSKVVYIYSSPFPYDAQSKRRVSRIKREMEYGGGIFLADFKIFGDGGRVSPFVQKDFGFHAGGHGDFEENMQMLEKVLGNLSRTKTVYFTHGERPNVYVKYAQEWFKKKGISNIKFVGSFNHYDPKNPLEKPGHLINIDN